MVSLRLVQLGIDHPHGEMYRTTLAHHDGFELVGGYDPDPDRAGAMLANEGVELPLFDEIERAIAQCTPDAVLVTLPNDMTPHAIATAARQGIHVFAEKPCGVSATAFTTAREAVQESGVRFAAAYLRRFSPAAIALRDLIADGVIGDLVSAQIRFATTNAALRNATYLAGSSIESVSATARPEGDALTNGERHWMFDHDRSGGGIMHWLGVHWLDLLRMVSGDEFTHLSATLETRSHAPIDVEDVASVTLESAGGMIATVSCAYVLPRSPDQVGIALQGAKGWITWDGSGPELRVHSSHPSWRAAPTRTLRFEPDPMPGYSGALGWEAFERFRTAIQDGNELPVNVNDAYQVLQLLDAIQRSGREHQRVSV